MGLDTDYCENILIPKCISSAQAAMENLKPVLGGMGTTSSNVGINRRQLLRNGKVILGQNPWDIYDPTMTVITFAETAGKPLANIIHMGTHLTAAGISPEISRDWAGVMTDRLEAESGALTLFLNGTAGDIAPRMANGGSTGNMKLAMELGGLAGIDAVRAYKSIKTFRDEKLELVTGVMELPFLPPVPEKEIPSRLAVLGDRWSFEKSSLEQLAELYNAGDLGPVSLKYPQTIVRIGSAVFVPFPFETSSEIGIRLRTESPFEHTLLVSCTNGSNSYLVAQSQLCRGGYEVESFLWFRPRQLPPDSDTLLIEQNLQLLARMQNS
jgi:hypothetical protein